VSEYEHNEHLLDEIQRLRESNFHLRKDCEEQKQRIKRLEEWIACLNPIAQHSGQSQNREWHGVDIGWLHLSQVVYLGEAKP
jgi:predicted RNase H-like nuclease (RuvC/YqgF family)